MIEILFYLTIELNHVWELIADKFWQIDTSSQEQQQDLSSGVCAPGMIRVSGQMKQDPDLNPFDNKNIESLQKNTCTKWMNKNYPERCIEFNKSKWLSISSTMKTKPMDFCIDQFEYPNHKGSYPLIFINFHEAKQLCQAENKRLCTETEWTFACEGEEASPYPTGYIRPSNICNIDKQWISYHPTELLPRTKASTELDRLWQGVPSGSMPQCRSPFKVYDMVGNIDEWTTKDRPDGQYQSILKGGYWGPVRTRCRPSTRSHNENHVFYQQGFRCCKDVK